jgi:hypothetical protein
VARNDLTCALSSVEDVERDEQDRERYPDQHSDAYLPEGHLGESIAGIVGRSSPSLTKWDSRKPVFRNDP